VLILAAGNSSRMGFPKQLLKWKNTTLLQHTMDTVKKISAEEIILVLGANSEKIKAEIDSNEVTVLVNKNWNLGLGNSIAYGINYIETILPEAENVLIMLADQPLINTEFLIKMIESFKLNPSRIVCTLYEDGKFGVPTIFNKKYFAELVGLNDDKGAKSVLKKYSKNLLFIDGKDIVNDIDTMKDYEALFKRFQ